MKLLIFLLFLLFSLISPEHYPQPYNRACGQKSGLSEAQYQSTIDNIWTRDEKCYITCELEETGYIKNGQISRQFRQEAQLMKNSSQQREKLFGNIQSLCIERADRVAELCEKGFTYYICYMTLGRVSGAFALFMSN